MDDFSVLLQAKLNQSESEKNINSDLATIAKAIEKLKVQAEIDHNSVKNIAQQLANIMNQKVVVDNIQIDTSKVSKTGSQAAQTFGSSFSKNLQSNLNTVKSNIENTIKGFSNQKLNSYDLSKMFNLNRADIDGSVIQQVRNLTNELNSLAKEALKTNSDSSWEGIVNKISSLSNVLSKFGSGRDLTGFKESLDVLDYFQNKKIFVGNKSEAIANTGLSVKELNNQFRNLGVTFTTVSDGATKLDTVWSELFNLSPNLQNFDTVGDQLNAIVEHFKNAKEALYGDSNLQPLNGGEVNKVLLDWLSNLENASKKVNIFREEQAELEKQIAQSSTSSSNTIIQNEEKKQQAYRKTAQTQKQISESESLVKSGANVRTYEHTNNAAREALNDFRELLKEENAVISISEKFGNLNGLTSFTVNVKRATGEVESLRYALKPVLDENGNEIGKVFGNVGAEINNSGAVKQIQAIENAFADYTQKLAQFKSTNSEIISGLTDPISNFESKLTGLKNGTSTIDEVVNSYKSLNTEASKITENFSRQLSPIDSAIRKLASGEETIAGLRAEVKGLDNSPKELNSELNKCVSLLENVKKIESEQGRTANWSAAYKEWEQSVNSLTAKIKVLKKEQSNVASTQIFNTADLKADNIAYITKVYNTIEKQMSSIQAMARNKGWEVVDVSGVEQADGKIKQLTLTVKDAEGAIKKLTMQREKLQGNGKAQYGLMQVGDVKVIETATQAQEKLAQSAEKANAKLAEQANKIQLSIETGGYDSKVESLIAKTQQWTDINGNARISTTALSTALNELTTASQAYANNPTEATQKRLIESSEKLDVEYKKITNSVRSMNAEMAKDSAIASLHNKVLDFMSKNGKAVKYSGEFKRIFDATAQGAELTKQKVTELNQEFNNAVMSARNAGKLGKTFFQTLREGMQSFSYWTSSTFIIMKIIQSIKGGISSVKALDTALVDLEKTTTMTSSEMEDFYYSSNKVAKQMGVTTEEIINQAAAWSRLGYGSAEAATKMAKLSSQFALISPGMDVDKATSGLVSIMKAYDVSVDDVLEKIESKVNIIGNNLALSNDNIVSMLQDSVSAMAEGRNTLEQTIALESAAYEIVQDNSVGNGFKTVSLRLRGLNEETQELDDSLKTIKGDLYDLTGVSIMEDANTYKSTYQILKEISEVWDSLTDKTRAEALELMFGKLRSNVGAAVLKNFSAAEKAMDLMADSAGSADRELSTVMNSLDYKLNRLSETGTSVAQNLFKRNDMKTVVDGLTSVMNVIDSLTSKLGLFGSIGLGAGIFAGVKNIGEPV